MTSQLGDLPSPSDLLAEIAAILHEFENLNPNSANDWVESAETPLSDPESEWLLAREAVIEHATRAGRLKQPIESPADEQAFWRLIDAAQILDRWHRPLVPATLSDPIQPMPQLHHEGILFAMSPARPYFGSCSSGILIPRHTIITAQRDEPIKPPGAQPLLFSFLSFTAYLPKMLAAQNQEKSSTRQVQLTYQTLPSTNPTPQALVSDAAEAPFKVAIAPMLEREADVEWRFSQSDTRYAVVPKYRKDRLRRVVKDAIARGIHLLIMPEASVLASNLPYLGKVIRQEIERSLTEDGTVPALLYVFAGTTGPTDDCPDTHDNFVCVFNSSGEEVLRQHKMFRWDMCADQVDRYQLKEHFCLNRGLSDPMCESIRDSKEIVLADFEDIGRLFNLICADMSFDLPGDWFFHLGIDWLNAPIFDQYVGAIPPIEGEKLNWICCRGIRAAKAGIRVIVSNSVALTCRLKAANEAKGSPRDGLDPCGIGLLVDGARSPSSFLRMEVSLTQPSPLLLVTEWRRDWAETPNC